MDKLTPYEEGYSSYWEGLDTTDNPYPYIICISYELSWSSEDWESGWYDAQNDASKGVYKCVD